MIALIVSLLTFLLALYIKYRFHIQFALLVRRGYKYLKEKHADSNRHHH